MCLSDLQSKSMETVQAEEETIQKQQWQLCDAAIREEADPCVASNNSNKKTGGRVTDIGVNLTNDEFKDHWRDVIVRAVDSGVDRIILTGLTIKESLQSLKMAEQWFEETGSPNLYATVGVHPYYAETWNEEEDGTKRRSSGGTASTDDEDNSSCPKEETDSVQQMRMLLKHPFAVAVGECGLDYNRFSTVPKDVQITAFREQVMLACELNFPLFLHERDAHDDFIKILDGIAEGNDLPPAVVHCFTGKPEEAAAYTERGFFISLAGTICQKNSRGKKLRKAIRGIPLDKLMVETDAPYMAFKEGRRSSEPADCVDVAKRLGEVVGVSFEEASDTTTKNAIDFFRIS